MLKHNTYSTSSLFIQLQFILYNTFQKDSNSQSFGKWGSNMLLNLTPPPPKKKKKKKKMYTCLLSSQFDYYNFFHLSLFVVCVI